MSEDSVDLRPWGYAIGGYMRPAGCAACGCDLWQVDKYASRCRPCAEAARENHFAEQAAMPVEQKTASLPPIIAQLRRLYHHMLNGGKITPDDMSRVIASLEEYNDAN